MPTLLSLLEEGAKRSAVEVVLESGQPVVFTTARGGEVEREVLPRTELFDMISAAVADEQQIELAVGNPVEFEIRAGGSDWSVVAEPGMEGMRVRARRDASELEIALDESSSRLTLGDIDLEAETEPLAPADTGTMLERSAIDPDPGPAAPFESGTWALDDEDDFDVELEGEPNLPSRGEAAASGVPGPPEPSYDFQASEAPPLTTDVESLDLPPPTDDDFIGVPDDDDDDDAEEFDPFAEPISSGSPPAPAEAKPKPKPAAPKPKPEPKLAASKRESAKTIPAMSAARNSPTEPELQAIEPAGQAATRRDIRPVRAPEADTQRDMPSYGKGGAELSELAVDIAEGSLVYIAEPGFAEGLAQSFQAPSLTLDDAVNPQEAWSRLRTMPRGAIIIVDREDPSALLGWILRRLEEGYRVFLESRARDPEGARRCLLGLDASERAEQWLSAQSELVVEPGDDGPAVRPA